MEERIEGKTEGNLKIESSGRKGIRLTIEIPEKGDVSIVVDKLELVESLHIGG